jgi:hypothetical protein
MKVSLHESGNWRTAFTNEYAKRIFDDSKPISDARLIESWTRPNEIASGVTLAFRIIIPTHDLEDISIDSISKEKIIWISPPEIEDLTEIDIILTHPSTVITNWPGKDGMGTQFLASHILPNGETLWLVYQYTKATNEWYKDKKRNRRLIAKTNPTTANYVGLLKSKKPRIMVSGYYPDGSRYYIDLSARKFLGTFTIMKFIYWSFLHDLRNK